MVFIMKYETYKATLNTIQDIYGAVDWYIRHIKKD